MNKIISAVTFFSILLSFYGCQQKFPKDIAVSWQEFEVSVQDGKIHKKEAKEGLEFLMKTIDTASRGMFENVPGNWVFPLEGYGLKALDKEGFRPDSVYGPYGVKGYDFFAGNRHGGHPAYDIFIRDKNQDSLDDKTGESVKAVAMCDMLVLSLNSGWTPESNLRGGNYVWFYSPTEKKLFYYAHLNNILVKPGEFIRKGTAVGTVGRTGLSAYKKASPTHLHLMVLGYENGKLTPFDYYSLLAGASAKN